jgi:hypothetical protein
VELLCPQRLPETRWECFIENIIAIQLQVPDFPAALAEAGITSDDNIKSLIISTEQQVTKSEFDLILLGAVCCKKETLLVKYYVVLPTVHVDLAKFICLRWFEG